MRKSTRRRPLAEPMQLRRAAPPRLIGGGSSSFGEARPRTGALAWAAFRSTSTMERQMTTKQAPSKGITAEERAAMRERVKELKAEAGKAEGDSAVVAKIAEMSQPDRGMAERLHALVKATVPDVVPRLWYGMPAYAADG